MGLIVGVAQLLHQSVHNLSHQFVRKVAVGSGSLLGHGVHGLDPGVYVVRQGFLLPVFGDVALVKHILEDHLALLFVGLFA